MFLCLFWLGYFLGIFFLFIHAFLSLFSYDILSFGYPSCISRHAFIICSYVVCLTFIFAFVFVLFPIPHVRFLFL